MSFRRLVCSYRRNSFVLSFRIDKKFERTIRSINSTVRRTSLRFSPMGSFCCKKFRSEEFFYQKSIDSLVSAEKTFPFRRKWVLWLTDRPDEDRRFVEFLRTRLRLFRDFTNLDEFFDLIVEKVPSEVILIVSFDDPRQIISFLDQISQIETVYIFSPNRTIDDLSRKSCKKLSAVLRTFDELWKDFSHRVYIDDLPFFPIEPNDESTENQRSIFQLFYSQIDFSSLRTFSVEKLQIENYSPENSILFIRKNSPIYLLRLRSNFTSSNRFLDVNFH